MHKKKIFITAVLWILTTTVLALTHIFPANASNTVSISPLYQVKVLVPGRRESGSFIVFNPATNDENLNYEIYIQPFWANEKNEVEFKAHEDYSNMASWITIDSTSGSVAPNDSKEVTFEIDVPENAPAGGQYAAIMVKSTKQTGNNMISESFEMAHLLYGEVAGKIIRQGEVTSIDLPGFMFSGQITGGATVRNDGNVHSDVAHTLKVYPLIGNEALYTNEESPEKSIIMPGASRYTTVAWDQTPSVGIFRVSYSVEFEGTKSELSKLVIVCPVWLLVIICLIVAIAVVRFVTDKKSGRSSKRTAD